jgi:hypothetical protein
VFHQQSTLPLLRTTTALKLTAAAGTAPGDIERRAAAVAAAAAGAAATVAAVAIAAAATAETRASRQCGFSPLLHRRRAVAAVRWTAVKTLLRIARSRPHFTYLIEDMTWSIAVLAYNTLRDVLRDFMLAATEHSISLSVALFTEHFPYILDGLFTHGTAIHMIDGLLALQSVRISGTQFVCCIMQQYFLD